MRNFRKGYRRRNGTCLPSFLRLWSERFFYSVMLAAYAFAQQKRELLRAIRAEAAKVSVVFEEEQR